MKSPNQSVRQEISDREINLHAEIFFASGGSFSAFFEKHEIPEEDQVGFEMTLLQKVAKSTCIKKSKIILDRIMDARNKLACNMYYGTYEFFFSSPFFPWLIYQMISKIIIVMKGEDRKG